MKRILRCDWLPDRAKGRYLVCKKIVFEFHITDQALCGQDSWTLASFSFRVFMDRDRIEVRKHAKTELCKYSVILTSRLSNNLRKTRENFKKGK